MMSINDWFEDVLPIRRKTSSDWIAPALAGLAAGLAVGIGVGLLFAPQPGDEMRSRIRRGAARVREKAGDLAQRTREQAASVTEPRREHAS